MSAVPLALEFAVLWMAGALLVGLFVGAVIAWGMQ